MRTVKEQFADELQDAFDSLERIEKRITATADLLAAQKALLEWKIQVARVIRGSLSREVAKAFLQVHEFDTVGTTGELMGDGIYRYKEYLQQLHAKMTVLNVTGEYPSATREAINAIDRCFEQLQDGIVRGGDNAQALWDNLRRWKDRAYKILAPYLGEEEAGEVYRHDDDFIEQARGLLAWLLNIKEEMQKYADDFTSTAPTTGHTESATDGRRIVVVHGRNLVIRDAMFDFLRALDLHPVEFATAVIETKKGAPTVGEVVDRLFVDAQATLILLTGDDDATLRKEFWVSHDPSYEHEPTPQARPNVLFEAGLAFARMPSRTLLVQIGNVKTFSDVAGRHIVRFDGDASTRHHLAERLEAIGCQVSRSGQDWLQAGNFPAIAKPTTMAAVATTPSGPRRIATERKEVMLRELSGLPAQQALVSWVPGEAESRIFSEDIAEIFRAAGWKVRHDSAIASADVEGVAILFYSDDCTGATPPIVVDRIVNAFKAGNIQLTVRCMNDPGVQKENLVIAVGHKQDVLFEVFAK